MPQDPPDEQLPQYPPVAGVGAGAVGPGGVGLGIVGLGGVPDPHVQVTEFGQLQYPFGAS